jgi:phosphatidylglycerophosphate synthase
MKNNPKLDMPRIILDARADINDQPLALANVLSQPWIFTALEMISVAGGLNRLTILTLPLFEEDVKRIILDYPGCQDVQVTTKAAPDINSSLTCHIEYMYWRRLFISSIKRGRTSFGRATFASINEVSDLKIAEDFAGRESAGHGTWILRYIYRPIGYQVAKTLSHSAITPNMVTSLSLLLILLASWFIVLDNYVLGLISLFLLHVFFILDVTDGILARLTKQGSDFGYWYDTMTDTIHDIALIFSFGVGSYVSTGDIFYILLAGVWLTGHVATSSNNLIMEAAKARSPKPDVIISMPQSDSWIKDIFRRASRVVMKSSGRAEVLAMVYSFGLLFDAEGMIVITFSFLMSYRVFAMFYLAYKNR